LLRRAAAQAEAVPAAAAAAAASSEKPAARYRSVAEERAGRAHDDGDRRGRPDDHVDVGREAGRAGEDGEHNEVRAVRGRGDEKPHGRLRVAARR